MLQSTLGRVPITTRCSTQYSATSRSRRRTVSSESQSSEQVSRRQTLQLLGLAAPLVWEALPAAAAQGNEAVHATSSSTNSSPAERCWQQLSSLPRGVCYAQAGPLQPLELPHLEHTCTSCFPACVGDKCILNINVTYPKGGSQLGMSPPYPLAIFSGGFTVNSAAYRSTAARLASWGYTVVRYDTRDALPDVLDDVTCVRLQRELIDWAATHPLMRRLADTRRVYLAGHSRGGKLAALTAAADSRVAALCLLDPVDVTQYAPLSDRFPSAAAALSAVAQTGRFLPVAVVGSGQSGDCAPRFNNYDSFFQASPSAAWQVLLPAAGHFQYLDQSTALQRAVCGGSAVDAPDESAVRHISQAVMVAWGEAMVKAPGTDILSNLAARCVSLGAPAGAAAPVGLGLRARSSSSSSNRSDIKSAARQAGPEWVHSFSDITDRDVDASSSNWGPPVDVSALRLAQPQQPAAADVGASSLKLQPAPPRLSSQLHERELDSRTYAAQSLHGNTIQQGLGSTGGAQVAQTVSEAQQQGQQLPGSSPLIQTRQEVWSVARAPSPAQLRELRGDLERLLVAVNYQSAAALDIRTAFRNFGV